MKLEPIQKSEIPKEITFKNRGVYTPLLRQLTAKTAIKIDREGETASKINGAVRSSAQSLRIKISIRSDNKYTYVTLKEKHGK